MNIVTSILASLGWHLIKNSPLAFVDLKTINDKLYDRVQDFESSYDRITPLQVTSIGVHFAFETMANAAEILTPGSMFDDYTAGFFRKWDTAFQLGVLVLDPFSDKTGVRLGTWLGEKINENRISKLGPKDPGTVGNPPTSTKPKIPKGGKTDDKPKPQQQDPSTIVVDERTYTK